MKSIVDTYNKPIKAHRIKYKDGLLFLKHYYEKSVDVKKKF